MQALAGLTAMATDVEAPGSKPGEVVLAGFPRPLSPRPRKMVCPSLVAP